MKKETTTSSIAITPKPKSISGITNPLLRLLRVREMAMLILILVVCVVMTNSIAIFFEYNQFPFHGSWLFNGRDGYHWNDALTYRRGI